jgi:polysaccharide biosynthesis/export protein
MRPIPFSILPIFALALGACSVQWPWSESPSPETTSSVAAQKLALTTARAPKAESGAGYRLDTGDRIRVVVSGQDALSNSYEIDGGGAIEVPSIGRVSARGLSTTQLAGVIARRLKKNSAAEAHVAVQVETYRPISIYGDVANPGQYPYVNNMTTETAIEMAGGLKPGGDRSSVSVSNGSQKRRPSAVGTPVEPGDTVTVTEER